MPELWQSGPYAMVYAWQDSGTDSPPVARPNSRMLAGDSCDMT